MVLPFDTIALTDFPDTDIAPEFVTVASLVSFSANNPTELSESNISIVAFVVSDLAALVYIAVFPEPLVIFNSCVFESSNSTSPFAIAISVFFFPSVDVILYSTGLNLFVVAL